MIQSDPVSLSSLLQLRITKLVVCKGYLEGEGGAASVLRFETYRTSHLLQNHLRDGESESHAASVDVLGLGDAAEELEQLVHLIGLYTDPCVHDLYHKDLVKEPYPHCYATAECELDRIPNQIE